MPAICLSVSPQLARFVERSELRDHQIVTYSFGDTEAVYLRGQWTMHQNVVKALSWHGHFIEGSRPLHGWRLSEQRPMPGSWCIWLKVFNVSTLDDS